eukprot:165520_1
MAENKEQEDTDFCKHCHEKTTLSTPEPAPYENAYIIPFKFTQKYNPDLDKKCWKVKLCKQIGKGASAAVYSVAVEVKGKEPLLASTDKRHYCVKIGSGETFNREIKIYSELQRRKYSDYLIIFLGHVCIKDT